jgi:hypothetical protein
MAKLMKTASWFTALPLDHVRIGISRGIPRPVAPGYRLFRKLQPGTWFNSVTVAEYIARYQAAVLDRLDPITVREDLERLAGGQIPVLCCFGRAGGPGWCHRALVAEWFHERLGITVPELGFEELPHDQHPLRPPAQ